MAKYAKVTLMALESIVEHGMQPRASWQQAADAVFGRGSSQAAKDCPRDAFLGLCEEGLLKGVPAGNYTHSKKSKMYAVAAAYALRDQPELALNKSELWRKVSEPGTAQNSEMTVVVALWKAGLTL